MSDGDADGSKPETGAGAEPPPSEPPPPAAAYGWAAAKEHMMSDKIQAGLWCTRVLTVVFSFAYILPLGFNPFSMYSKALISNAATSALRLHQRMPNFQLSREYFSQLFLEDSCHYLLFSMMFALSVAPVTVALVPVFLFAVMHSASYTRQLLDKLGPGSMPLIRRGLDKLGANQPSLLRFVAMNEILLMPTLLFMIFGGKTTILAPFIYYRFLSLRYTSRRNPYCRQLFYELRMAFEYLCNHPSCPAFVGNIVRKAIALVCRIAPQAQPAPAQ